MGTTIVEKILGAHARGGPARVGEVVVAKVAVEVTRTIGIATIVARSFGRQFFRNRLNNGLPVEVLPLPPVVRASLAADGLFRSLSAHPNWQVR